LKNQELPEHIDQNILKDEIIQLASIRAKKTGISEHRLRPVHVYKEDENKVIAIITNQLEWEYNTIAQLYKKRWDIELFFEALKQNLQVKTFWGTSENAVKSQIYVALISYLNYPFASLSCINNGFEYIKFSISLLKLPFGWAFLLN
jgi:IS4 transposase